MSELELPNMTLLRLRLWDSSTQSWLPAEILSHLKKGGLLVTFSTVPRLTLTAPWSQSLIMLGSCLAHCDHFVEGIRPPWPIGCYKVQVMSLLWRKQCLQGVSRTPCCYCHLYLTLVAAILSACSYF